MYKSNSLINEEKYKLLSNRLKSKFQSSFPFHSDIEEKEFKDDFINDYLDGFESKRFYIIFPDINELIECLDLFLDILEEEEVEKRIKHWEEECNSSWYFEDVSRDEIMILVNTIKNKRKK